MRLILAIFLPWLQCFTIGRPFAGIFCRILQVTLIGWIPAAIWSAYALSQYKTDKKIKKIALKEALNYELPEVQDVNEIEVEGEEAVSSENDDSQISLDF